MSQKLGKQLIRSVVTALAAIAFGIFPASETTNHITYAEVNSLTPSVEWSLEQYPNYYSIEGKSNIDTKDFPKLYTTTEKVYKKVVEALSALLFLICNTLHLMAMVVQELPMALSQRI